MRRDKGRLDAAGVRVLLVGMGAPEQAEPFRRRFQVPFPLACDPQQVLYGLSSIPRGRVAQVLGPAALARGVGAMLRGHVAGIPVGDVLQLPGAVGVEEHGVVWYVHQGTSASDHATAEAILAAWEGHRGG